MPGIVLSKTVGEEERRKREEGRGRGEREFSLEWFSSFRFPALVQADQQENRAASN